MSMTLCEACGDELERARELYMASFPPEERRDWGDIAGADSSPRLRVLHDGDEFAGFVTTWEFDDFIYIEHLATEPSMRNRGLGAKTLAALSGLGKALVLECEHPGCSDPMAGRRLEFYRRNGFGIIDEGYVQPPYSAGLPEVPLLLLATAELMQQK